VATYREPGGERRYYISPRAKFFMIFSGEMAASDWIGPGAHPECELRWDARVHIENGYPVLWNGRTGRAGCLLWPDGSVTTLALP
jgi:hypothetical protein